MGVEGQLLVDGASRNADREPIEVSASARQLVDPALHVVQGVDDRFGPVGAEIGPPVVVSRYAEIGSGIRIESDEFVDEVAAQIERGMGQVGGHRRHSAVGIGPILRPAGAAGYPVVRRTAVDDGRVDHAVQSATA